MVIVANIQRIYKSRGEINFDYGLKIQHKVHRTVSLYILSKALNDSSKHTLSFQFSSNMVRYKSFSLKTQMLTF